MKFSTKITFLLILAIFLVSLLSGNIKVEASAPLLIKTADNPAVYFVSSRLNAKKAILSSEVFNSYNNQWSWVKTVSQSTLDSYPNITVIKTEDSSAVYRIEGNTKRVITSSEVFKSFGYNWNDIFVVNNTDLDSYRTGTPITESSINATSVNLSNGRAEPGVTEDQLEITFVQDSLINSVALTNTWHKFAEINFQSLNGNSAVIKRLTLTYVGFSHGKDDMDYIYLTDDQDRPLNYTFNNYNELITFNLDRSPILVPAYETKTIKVYGMAKRPGTLLGLSINSPEAVETAANIAGDFPLNGTKYRVIDGGRFIGQIKIDEQPISEAIRKVLVNSKNQSLLNLSLTETTGEHDSIIKQITLTKEGKIPDQYITNIDLVSENGTVLATAESARNGKVVIELKRPYRLEAGETANFLIRADFVGGVDKKARLILENNLDIFIEDAEYGYRILPTSDHQIGTGNSSTYGQVEIIDTDANIYINNNLEDRDFPAGTDGAVIGSFTIKANGSNFDFNGFDLSITSEGNLPLNSDIIFKHGDTILNTYPARDFDDNFRSISFIHDVEIESGKKYTFEIIGDISDKTTNLDSYHVTLKNFDIKSTDNRQFAEDWYITGPRIGVLVSEVGVSLNEKYDSQLMVPTNMSKQLIGSFKLQIGQAEDMYISGVTISETIADQISTIYGYENIHVAINHKILDTIENPVSSPHIFTFPTRKLSKGRSYTLEFYADINPEADGQTIQIKLDNIFMVGVESHARPKITYQDQLGQTIDIITSKITIEPRNNDIFQLLNLRDGEVILGTFTVSNQSAEKVRIKELYLYEAPDSESLSYQNGFSKLRLINENGKRIGRQISRPTIGGNKLGNFKLDPGETMTLSVVVKVTESVATDTINLMVQDIKAYGYTSKQYIEIVNDNATLGETYLNTLD